MGAPATVPGVIEIMSEDLGDHTYEGVCNVTPRKYEGHTRIGDNESTAKFIAYLANNATAIAAAIEVLAELDRLYRLRFEIAKREKDGIDCKHELRVYGEQKKAAWQQSAAALSQLKD